MPLLLRLCLFYRPHLNQKWRSGEAECLCLLVSTEPIWVEFGYLLLILSSLIVVGAIRILFITTFQIFTVYFTAELNILHPFFVISSLQVHAVCKSFVEWDGSSSHIFDHRFIKKKYIEKQWIEYFNLRLIVSKLWNKVYLLFVVLLNHMYTISCLCFTIFLLGL